jgi:hypothetical protein
MAGVDLQANVSPEVDSCRKYNNNEQKIEKPDGESPYEHYFMTMSI